MSPIPIENGGNFAHFPPGDVRKPVVEGTDVFFGIPRTKNSTFVDHSILT